MLRSLPKGRSLFIRTDFSDDDKFDAVVASASAPYIGENGVEYPGAQLTVVDDEDFGGMTVAELVDIVGAPRPNFVFVADERTLTDSEHPILAVDTLTVSATEANIQTLRVIPSQLAVIEANLSVANLDFASFSSSASADGVYRGLSREPAQTMLTKAELFEVIGRNTSTPALAQLHAELPSTDIASLPLVPADLAKNHQNIAAANYIGTEELVGVDDYLVATAGGGTAIGLTIPIPGGYWTVALLPDPLRPLAAFKVQMPVYLPGQ